MLASYFHQSTPIHRDCAQTQTPVLDTARRIRSALILNLSTNKNTTFSFSFMPVQRPNYMHLPLLYERHRFCWGSSTGVSDMFFPYALNQTQFQTGCNSQYGPIRPWDLSNMEGGVWLAALVSLS